MSNNPIAVMLEEHEIIKKTEEIINDCEEMMVNDPGTYVDVVTQLIEFFREYADGYHHRKEEDILFPAIKNHPDFLLQELIDEFEDHHVSFRDYTRAIEEAMEEGDYEESYKELNNYFQDLLDHIAAEDEELFVLAENLLDEEELETMFFKFKDVDLELGEERKKEFEQKIIDLASIG